MRFIDFLAGVIFAFAWGSNVVAMKLSVAEISPVLSNLLRFVIASLVLLPFVGRNNSLSWPIIRLAFFYSTFITLAILAVKESSSVSLLILIFQLNTPFTAILAWVVLKEVIDLQKIIGISLSFIGVSIVLIKPDMECNFLSVSLMMSAALFSSMFNISLKQANVDNKMAFLGWISIISIPYLLLICLFMGQLNFTVMANMSSIAWGAILYSALISTVLGFGLWFYLVKYYPLSQVSSFGLLAPIFGTICSIILFDERLYPNFVVGGIFTLLGILVVLIRRVEIAK
jgi:O-acetylserine/cysteine efflux transporter